MNVSKQKNNNIYINEKQNNILHPHWDSMYVSKQKKQIFSLESQEVLNYDQKKKVIILMYLLSIFDVKSFLYTIWAFVSFKRKKYISPQCVWTLHLNKKKYTSISNNFVLIHHVWWIIVAIKRRTVKMASKTN